MAGNSRWFWFDPDFNFRFLPRSVGGQTVIARCQGWMDRQPSTDRRFRSLATVDGRTLAGQMHWLVYLLVVKFLANGWWGNYS
jgi:hypothetical protein